MLLSALAFILTACGLNSDSSALSAECVRIHIRADSDSDLDQAVKLKVRDSVCAYLTGRLENVKDKKEAMSVLNSERDTLKQIADSTLYDNGFDYKATVSLSNEYFPEKTYDSYTFPAGAYDALIIELGSGSGQNWWCVAFPPLCFVPNGGSGERIVYKSWIKEKLEELFG